MSGCQCVGLAHCKCADFVGFYSGNFVCGSVLCVVDDAVFHYKEFDGADHGFGEDGLYICNLGIRAEGCKVIGSEDVAYPYLGVGFCGAAYREDNFVIAPSEVAASGEGLVPYQDVLEVAGPGVVAVVCRGRGLGEVKGCHRACGSRQTMLVGVVG